MGNIFDENEKLLHNVFINS